MNERLYGVVKGRVQGVGFRWFVQQRALKLGLRGFVKNLSNGDVEFEAEGERANLESFLTAVSRGPAFSKVVNVRSEWKEAAGRYDGFEITY
jgi:acylphosphatase